MIKTIIKAIYSAFISIVLISIVLAGWTGFTFISQSSKSTEIINVMQNIYSSQKSVLIDVIELSKILIKDPNEGTNKDNNNFSIETESLRELADNSQFDESTISEDDGDNPLGIVIEPLLPEVNENKLPELNEETLVFEKNEFSKNKMEMEMEMEMN